jgi:iron-sulfur cluster insertion protein
MTPPGEAGFTLTLTDAAVDKVKYFAKSMPDSENKPLRIFIQGGGCSGFQYGFTFDEKRENDNVLEQGGVTVVVDPQSAQYLRGAKVNYIEDFRGAGFAVENPNATGGCGCGKSFNA